MSTPVPNLTITTVEDLLSAPADLGRCELVRGELVMMSPGKGRHGAIEARIVKLLANFVDSQGLGTVFGSSAGYVLARNPDTVREPDVSFLSTTRLGDQDLDSFLEGAPDLAVEILSPSNSARDMAAKADDCLAAGCQVVWVVDPLRKSILVYHADAPAIALTEDDTLTESALLPGLSLKVREVFP